MIICGCVALVLGYLAGLRFRVMVVLPLELGAAAIAAALALIGHVGPGQAGVGFVVFSVGVQMGYALALACPLPARPSAQRRLLKA